MFKYWHLFAPFLFLGIVPLVIPPIISPVKIPTTGWDTQVKKTTREYLKFLAARCGYIFFLQPGPAPGQSIGYFGPDINLPVPQPALSINMGGHSTVESLSFSLNVLPRKSESTQSWIHYT
jgi:hypothetical protein